MVRGNAAESNAMSLIGASILLLSASATRYVDFWVVAATTNFDDVVFIDKSTIAPAAGGWTSFWYENVFNGSRSKVAKSIRSNGRANCATRNFAVDATLGYGNDGRLAGELTDVAPPHAVRPDTVEDKLLSFVCGDESNAVQMPRGSVTVTVANSFYARPPADVARVLAGSRAAAPASVVSNDDARLRSFLDSKGGYRDKDGGYYNPAAGTYTDKVGGVVDNWRGYTYNDGSYKSKNGDYYDAPTKTVHLASGDVFKKPDDMTSTEVIQILRGNVADTGGFDKDLTRRSMMSAIARDHPAGSPR